MRCLCMDLTPHLAKKSLCSSQPTHLSYYVSEFVFYGLKQGILCGHRQYNKLCEKEMYYSKAFI